MMKLDWCSNEAATYACKRWHYSRSMPIGKLIKVGVWEENKFIGVVIFSRGASATLLSRYELNQTEGCELTRIALNKHKTPVTKIVSIALKFLQQMAPSMRLVVSFADPYQGHAGKIYQAGNWVYSGKSSGCREFYYKGKKLHQRQTSASGIVQMFEGTMVKCPKRSDCIIVKKSGKHRYLMPLDKEMRKQIEPLSEPYPRGLIEEQQIPSVEGSASLTSTLQTQAAS